MRRGKERIDYKVLNDEGRKVGKKSNSNELSVPSTVQNNTSFDNNDQLNVSNAFHDVHSVSSVSDDFRSVSSELDISSDGASEGETINNVSLDYETVDDPFATQLTDLSLQLENFVVRDAEMADAATKLRNQAEAVSEDINDYIEENQFTQSSSIVDIDTSITKVEELRTKYRSIHKDLKSSHPDYETDSKPSYEKDIQSIKVYLAEIKKVKSSIRDQEHSENIKLVNDHQDMVKGDSERKKETSVFLLSDVERIMDLLLDETDVFANSEITDEEVWEVKKNLPTIQKQLDAMSEKYKELLEIIPNSVPQKKEKLDKLSTKHKKLLKAEKEFRIQLDSEIKKRELSKEKSFEASTLNIKLPMFSGYESSMDVYTFQEKFEKVYKSKTPKRLMPEVLKNNYLEGSAYEYVKRLESIDEIWSSLKSAFGDPRMMMMKRVQELEAVPHLWRVKDAEKAKNNLSKVVNLIDELMNIAKVHKIEDNLYYGDTIYSIYKVMGDNRVAKFLEDTFEDDLKGKDLWVELVKYLEREIKLYTEKAMIHRNMELKSSKDEKDKDRDKDKNKDLKTKMYQTSGGGGVDGEDTPPPPTDGKNKRDQTHCSLCNKTDHVTTKGPYGMKLIQYFSCEKFAGSSPGQRFNYLKTKGLCTQCLFPGAKASTGKHVDGTCQSIYTCKNPAHNASPIKKHVLVCEEHKNEDANKQLMEEYRTKCISRSNNLPAFAKEIKLSFHTGMYSVVSETFAAAKNEKPDDVGVYMMQHIVVGEEEFVTFFDSGCGDMCVSKDAINRLGELSELIVNGPTPLGGIGDIVIESPHGIYDVSLPLFDGSTAKLRGVALDNLTNDFPEYILNSQIQTDIRTAYEESGGDASNLPLLPYSVGGKVDLMIGIKYNRYIPTEIFKLPSGLAIYESPFLSADGSRGVVGGPHPLITKINKEFFGRGTSVQFTMYASQQLQIYRMGLLVNPDLLFLDPKDPKDKVQEPLLAAPPINNSFCCKTGSNNSNCDCAVVLRNQRIFEEVENAGSQITFRCIKCRDCKDCRNSEKIEMISIREEAEQEAIKKSVTIDFERCVSTAVLPFMEDPLKKIAPNRERAMKVYKNTVNKLAKDEARKQQIIKFENKLQSLKMVEFVWNLTDEQQEMIRNAPLQYFYPWRPVYNSNSVSTPARMVFDASMPTATGYSMNDVLAKGRNQMNKLVEIFIRWFTKRSAFHTDVSKMYNTLKLHEKHWMYQMYLWHPDLDPNEQPVAKVLPTVTYGVRSSMNQAEYALRQTANEQKMQYPRTCDIVNHDTYVDDCMSGEDTDELAEKSCEDVGVVLARGGFQLKGFTHSGKPPPAHLSENGVSINVAGMVWFSEDDVLQLNIDELNFADKVRGKTPTEKVKVMPERLTRRQCASKVAEIFDLTGKITPITAGMKMDLHDLTSIKELQWADAIPDNLRGVWKSHFEMMEEIKTLKFNRCVVPSDAVSLDIETIDTGDASKSITCAAIYARFQRKNGEFSCQLVFARSKLVPDGTTQPRAECLAALLNTHTGEVVKRAFGDLYKGSWKLCDSQIVLFWINNQQKALKPWVRTRVIEILQFTLRSQWYYIESKKLIADLGTRRGVKIEDVNIDSPWINGYEWMRQDSSTFPIVSVNDLTLSSSESEGYKKEVFAPFNNVEDLTSFQWPPYDIHYATSHIAVCSRFKADEISARYEFSKYLLDPNRLKFSSVVRVMSMVFKYVRALLRVVKSKRQEHVQGTPPIVFESTTSVFLTDEELAVGRNYYIKKATAEVIRFAKKSDYQNISTEQNGILYYTGRIQPEQQVQSAVGMTDVMKDLSQTTFFVPLVEAQSPIAYSIVSEIHWEHAVAKHSGVETVHRYVMKECFILNGRNLVKLFRKNCERCRYLAKRTVDVVMGPVSSQNLTIAPAFYISQVDLAGPFISYSPHNKRNTVKIWFAVYCCSTTSTISLKVMEDYSAAGFIQSFIRFSCEHGYPKMLVSDPGSQLLKSYEVMKINFTDLQNQLHRDMSVEFDVVPVGGHNVTGKVERKIRSVKESITKSFDKRRLSILQWETVGAEVANAINDLPLALGNSVSDFESMDILTPNRLRLGRNNNRSPVGPMHVTSDPSKFFKDNTDIFNCWFECWLTGYVPQLMHHPKWFNTNYHLKEGDVVLFLKKEGLLNETYQFGIIESVEISRDQIVRAANVRYRNHDESFDRTTRRTVRQLIVIHRVDELNIVYELGQIATIADIKRKLHDESRSC